MKIHNRLDLDTLHFSFSWVALAAEGVREGGGEGTRSTPSMLNYFELIIARDIIRNRIRTALFQGGKMSRSAMDQLTLPGIPPVEFSRMLARFVTEGLLRCGIRDGSLVYFL